MVQTGELKNIINELLGIQFNIEKKRLDKMERFKTLLHTSTKQR